MSTKWTAKQVLGTVSQLMQDHLDDPNVAEARVMLRAYAALLEQREAVTDEDIRVACDAIGIPVDGDEPFLDGTDVKRALESYASSHANHVPDAGAGSKRLKALEQAIAEYKGAEDGYANSYAASIDRRADQIMREALP